MRPQFEVLEGRMLLDGAGVQEAPILSAEIQGPNPHIEREPNDTAEEANPIQVDPAVIDFDCAVGPCAVPFEWRERRYGYMVGSLGNGSTEPDVDFFTFSAAGERRIGVAVSASYLTDGSQLQLLGVDGSVVAVAQARQTPNEQHVEELRIDYYTRVAGTFYVRVGPSASADLNEPYSLNVNIIPEPRIEHEPNDKPDQANPILLRTGYECQPMCTSVHQVEGEPRAFFSVQSDNASPIPGQPNRAGLISGAIGSGSDIRDVDYFSFSSDADQQILLRIDGGFDHSIKEKGIFAELLDQNGDVLATTEFHASLLNGYDSPVGVLNYFTSAGGDFFVRVLQLSDTAIAGEQNFQVFVSVAPPKPQGLDELEPNDTIGQANRIEFVHASDGVCLALTCPRSPLPIADERHRLVQGIAGGPLRDVDVFSLEVLAGEHMRVGFGRDRPSPPTTTEPDQGAHPRLIATVLDAAGNEIGHVSIDGSTPVIFDSETVGVYFVRVEAEAGTPDNEAVPYRLHLHAITFTPEGPNESEPNDNFELANPIALAVRPPFLPGTELRGGAVRGIAGGPGHDQDEFRFTVRGGQRVTVGIAALGKIYGNCLDGVVSDGVTCVQACIDPALPCVDNLPLLIADRPIHVTVFDSFGNAVGDGESSAGQSGAISFRAGAAGEYFAVVSVSPDSDAYVFYRLGVLSQLTIDSSETNVGGPPREVTLRHGQSFRYTDSDGDLVQVNFDGRAGSARVIFNGPNADGSNIASVVVSGARGDGSFRVRTTGSAEIGSLEIQGRPANARRSGSFDNVSIDGNLGSFASNVNVRSIAIDGVLGELIAPGREISKLNAMVFDHAIAEVSSIRKLRIEQEMSSAIFGLFLPAGEQP